MKTVLHSKRSSYFITTIYDLCQYGNSYIIVAYDNKDNHDVMKYLNNYDEALAYFNSMI